MFILIIIATPVVMELLSWPMHRFLFHGPLWPLHEDHHRSHKGALEKNDLFSSFFALISIGLIMGSIYLEDYGVALAVGLGMALYGFLYFWIHDGLAHKRWSPPQFMRPRWAEVVKHNHRRHHQKSTKNGQGPYGLFF
ncbi:MAG: beta-carotene hydroxylase [Myxococcales bacterium]|nr:beta-carotene hydroxylase [Myxococcales bacterium]|tara:strand:+ start:7682 stop:8095 length:414 start_codon:yes stop_codon:yes gene_type:complete